MQRSQQRIYLYGLAGFVLLLLFLPSIETSGADLTIEPVSPRLTVSPPDTTTVLFRLINGADRTLKLSLELQLPEGWTPLIPPGTATLNPGESKLLTLPVKVPEQARANTYKIALQATSEDKGITEKGSVEVKVEKSFQVSLEGPSEGGRTIPGKEVSYTLFMTNKGNIPSKFTISTRSTCPAELDRETVNLVPGEQAEIRVRQKIPRDTEKRECALTVTVQSALKKAVSEEFGITTRILPPPPDQIKRDLGLIYDVSVLLDEDWGSEEGRSRSASIFGYAEATDTFSEFSLTTSNLLSSESEKIDYFDFTADFSDYSIQLGDLSWDGGRWSSLDGRGIKFVTDRDSLINVSLSHLGENQNGASLRFSTKEHLLELSGSKTGQGTAGRNAVDIMLLSGRQDDNGELGMELASDREGWGARGWRSWKNNNSMSQLNVEYIDAPFSGYSDSNLGLNLSLTLEEEPLNFWGRLTHDLSWDEEGRLTRTGFSLGTNGSFVESPLGFDLALRGEYDDGSLNGTVYSERTFRISGGIGFDAEKISLDLELIHETESKLDSTKLSSLTEVSTSLEPEISDFSPEIRFEWSKTVDYLENTVERESGLIFTETGRLKGLERSFSLSLKRINQSLSLSTDISTELPRQGHAYLSFKKTEEDFSIGLNLEKSFSYIANWWPVKGQALGKVFWDEDLDGVPDAGEAGLSGVILKLGKELATTDSDGAFAFPPEEPNTYDLQLVKLPRGYIAMVDSPQTVSLKAGKRSKVNIPVAKTAKVTGKVVQLPEPKEEENNAEANQGEQVTGESEEAKPMASVGIRLIGGKRTYYTTTGSGGNFRFDRLRPGGWQLEIDKETLPVRHYPKKEKIDFRVGQGEEKKFELVIYKEEREIQWMD